MFLLDKQSHTRITFWMYLLAQKEDISNNLYLKKLLCILQSFVIIVVEVSTKSFLYQPKGINNNDFTLMSVFVYRRLQKKLKPTNI